MPRAGSKSSDLWAAAVAYWCASYDVKMSTFWSLPSGVLASSGASPRAAQLFVGVLHADLRPLLLLRGARLACESFVRRRDGTTLRFAEARFQTAVWSRRVENPRQVLDLGSPLLDSRTLPSAALASSRPLPFPLGQYARVTSSPAPCPPSKLVCDRRAPPSAACRPSKPRQRHPTRAARTSRAATTGASESLRWLQAALSESEAARAC